MALSDIILNSGEVIIRLTSSSSGMAADGKAINFGYVEVVNDLCDSAIVGDVVIIRNLELATPFMQISGQRYYIVQENNISGKEYLAP